MNFWDRGPWWASAAGEWNATRNWVAANPIACSWDNGPYISFILYIIYAIVCVLLVEVNHDNLYRETYLRL